MTLTLLALATSFASAADLDGDGCVDSYFNDNGACVAVSATIDPGAVVGDRAEIGADTALQADVFVGARSVLEGRSALTGARVVGSGTIIGRSVTIGTDHTIGSDNTIGRNTNAGERLDMGANASIGYAATLGNDVTIGDGAVVGSLVGIGAKTELLAGATLARGVTIADSTTAASIGGVVGPQVTIGSDNALAATARIRKDATLGNDVTVLGNARIARGAVIGDGVTIGANARIGAGATVTATTIVPDGAVIPRGETYDDPSAGQFVGGTLLDPTEMSQINAWVGDPNAEWALCYSRSVHGASASTFHNLCNGRPDTVAVLTTSAGKKFGGYTPITWDTGCYATEGSQSSFLFSLTNDFKHVLVSPNHHTCGTSNHGTTFGGGHDMYINGSMSVGYCNLGHTYACRAGLSGNGCRTDFCGTTGAVTPTEYEVYYRTN